MSKNIRIIQQHPETLRWGFIEVSNDESEKIILLGDKDFDTFREASLWALGFRIGEYKRVDPKQLLIKDLLAEKRELEDIISILDSRIAEVNSQSSEQYQLSLYEKSTHNKALTS